MYQMGCQSPFFLPSAQGAAYEQAKLAAKKICEANSGKIAEPR